MEISNPDIAYGRVNLDFGRGFYVTALKTQAEKWAKRRAHEAKSSPIVNVYLFDESDLNVLRFCGYSEAWLDFVVQNRRRREPSLSVEYDVVYGNVADDAVARIVNLYVELLMNDRLRGADKTFFINQLQFSEPNNQYCIASQKGIGQLHFNTCYTIKAF